MRHQGAGWHRNAALRGAGSWKHETKVAKFKSLLRVIEVQRLIRVAQRAPTPGAQGAGTANLSGDPQIKPHPAPPTLGPHEEAAL